MDLSHIDVGTALTGAFAFAFPAVMAIITWFVLRRESHNVRLVAAIAAFFLPFVAVFGLVFYVKLRPQIRRAAAQVREAVTQAQSQAQAPPSSRSAGTGAELRIDPADLLAKARSAVNPAASASKARSAPVTSVTADPARLLSSDLSIRFGKAADGERKLNIPKVVE